MSSFLPESAGDKAVTSSDQSLTDGDKALLKRVFGKPQVIPSAFWSYLVDYISVNQPPIPLSQIFGFKKAFAVASTVAELGTPTSVSQTLLRIGSVAPYTYRQLSWDPDQAKWTSETEKVLNLNWSALGLGGNTTSDVTSTSIYHSELVTAGLTLQFRYVGNIRVTVGTGSMAVKLTAYSSGDTAAGSTGTSSLLASGTYTTTTWKDSGWVTAPTLATPEAMAEVVVQVSQAGGNWDAFATGALLSRWTA